MNSRGGATDDEPVFRSQKGGALSASQIYRIVKDAAKQAGIVKDVSPHWLRHAHASHALDRGARVNLGKVMQVRSSLATSSRALGLQGDSSALYLAMGAVP